MDAPKTDAANLLRNAWIEMDLPVAHVHPQHDADELERRARGPRLGTARRRIRHRKRTDGSFEAGKRLRQSECGVRLGFELREDDAIGFVAVTVPRESG